MQLIQVAPDGVFADTQPLAQVSDAYMRVFPQDFQYLRLPFVLKQGLITHSSHPSLSKLMEYILFMSLCGKYA
jgi:hypothetical protein